MVKNILSSGSMEKSSDYVAKAHVKQAKLFNPISSSVLNRLYNDLKLKEEIESIDRKWRR